MKENADAGATDLLWPTAGEAPFLAFHSLTSICSGVSSCASHTVSPPGILTALKNVCSMRDLMGTIVANFHTLIILILI